MTFEYSLQFNVKGFYIYSLLKIQLIFINEYKILKNATNLFNI